MTSYSRFFLSTFLCTYSKSLLNKHIMNPYIEISRSLKILLLIELLEILYLPLLLNFFLQSLDHILIRRLPMLLFLSKCLHPFILNALHRSDPLLPLLHLFVPFLLSLVCGLLLLLPFPILELLHFKQCLPELH